MSFVLFAFGQVVALLLASWSLDVVSGRPFPVQFLGNMVSTALLASVFLYYGKRIGRSDTTVGSTETGTERATEF